MKRLQDISRNELEKLEQEIGNISDTALSKKYEIGSGIIFRLRTKNGIKAIDPGSYDRCRINERCFDDINSISSYWLGYLFADGCVCNTTGNRHIISLTSIDRDMMEKYSSFLEHKGNIGSRKIKNGLVYTLGIDNRYLYDKLNNYDMINRKTHILCPPNIKEEHYFSFLCGYFDGDGCISLNTNINS